MSVRIRMAVGLTAALLALAGVWVGLSLQAPADAVAAAPAVTGDYVLRDYGGCVAVYRPWDESSPEQVTDIEIWLLPSADRIQLRSGIGARDDDALARLLEDLNS